MRTRGFYHPALSIVLGSIILLLMESFANAKPLIAFQSNRDGKSALYTLDPDTGKVTHLAELPGDRPVITPDGHRVAFRLAKNNKIIGLGILDIDSGKVTQVTDHPLDEDPKWSPDGNQLVFWRNWEGIYIVNIHTRSVKNVTNTMETDPSWSPAGSKLTFACSDEKSVKICTMDLDGQNRRTLTKEMGNNHHPVWSPDGRRIAFTSDVEAPGPTSNLFLIDSDGNNQKRLTVSQDPEGYPSWSPDGKWIAWHRRGEIYAIDLDTGKIRNLTNQLLVADAYPSWFDPTFPISSLGKKLSLWGWLKTLK